MKYGNVKDADGSFPALEEGNYRLKVSEIRDANKEGEQQTDKNGDPYVWVVFRVDGHDQKIWHMVYPNPDPEKTSYGPRSAELKSFLEAIECNLEGGDTADWQDHTCRAFVTVEEYQGKERNKIKFFEQIESGSEKKEAFKDDDDDLPF